MANDTPTITWTGASGKKYKYWIYALPPNLDAKGGNYMMLKETQPGTWRTIYIGQTSDLSERFDDHHKAACFKRNGATHICAHLNANKADRLAEEADLLDNYNPACND